MNIDRDLFGKEKLLKLLVVNYELDAKSIIEEIHKEIKLFRKQTPQSDDICMSCLKYSN